MSPKVFRRFSKSLSFCLERQICRFKALYSANVKGLFVSSISAFSPPSLAVGYRPGHIIRFYHEAIEELAKEKEEFTLEEMTEKWNSRAEEKKSSDAIRRWAAFLCSIGYLTSKPDPIDKRRQLYKAIHNSEKSRNLLNSQFSSIFTLETLKEWLKGAEKIFAQNTLSLRENIISEREITIEELYNKHFYSETGSCANISLNENKASLTENASKLVENDKINKLRNFKAIYWSDGYYGWHKCEVCGYTKLTSWKAEPSKAKASGYAKIVKRRGKNSSRQETPKPVVSSAETPVCPMCGGTRLYRDGLRYLANGSTIQRWLCRTCGYRFTEKNLNRSDRFQHASKVDRQILNCAETLTSNCQGSCEATSALGAVQALAEVETRQERPTREGASTLSQQKIVDFIWYMKRNGYAEATIQGRVRLIKRLARLGANLYDPENVKHVIAKQPWSAGRKDLACDAYTTFLAMNGGTWQRPTYKRVEKEPFIPQPTEIKQLIPGCSPRMACFLQLLLETAMRPGEAWQLTWADYDKATRTVRVTPEKGSKSRTYKISKELAEMLDNLPRKYGERIFSSSNMPIDHHNRNFALQRKRIAQKLKNPRLLRISFKTLRHFKATMEAWRTKDPSTSKTF